MSVSRNILITGASSGIGSASSVVLSRAGHKVFNADLAPPPAENGGTFIECDVTDPEYVEMLFQRINAETGALDVLILNAGRGIHELLAEGDPEKWKKIIDINLMGTLRILRAFLPGMLEKMGAQVLFMSSVAAESPYAYGGVYSASKSAIESVARTLDLECGDRIRVTIIRPGVTDTNFFKNMVSGGHTVEEIGLGHISGTAIAEQILSLISLPYGQKITEINIMPAGQPGLA